MTATSRASLAVALLLFAACGDDDGPRDAHDDTAADTPVDVADTADTGPDAPADADPDPDAAPDGDVDSADGDEAPDVDPDPDADGGPDVGSTPVPIDTDAWLPAPGRGAVSARRIESIDELPPGPSVQGRVGDWVIESDAARFVIEDVDRTMSPCPFGGNVIDAAPLDGTTVDTLGEVCPMINLGQTFRARSVEVLEDGSGGRAVLAVTGDMQALDFLNIRAMAGGYLGGLTLDLALAPERVRPVTMTIYYALTPGSTALRTVTAFRNDGAEDHYLAAGHLLRPAGQGVFFNPLNAMGGYGYRSLGVDNINATPVAFAAYTHETGTWSYVPDPDPAIGGPLPVGAGSLSVAGVTGTLLGTVDLVGVLLAQEGRLPTQEGVIGLAPGASAIRGHHLIVGDGSLAATIDVAYEVLEVSTGVVGGVVRDGEGDGVPDVRVTAVDVEGRGLNQALSDSDGRYAMRVPAGVEVEVRAWAPGRAGVADGLATASADSATEADIDTVDPGVVEVRVTTPDGAPTVARLAITCESECPRPLGAERDNTVDDIPREFAALVPVGLDGIARAELQPGAYGVVVSRGLEWSVWPADAPSTGGEFVTVVSGETQVLDAEIAPVIDSAGALSGDFHVHALSSSDSSVANEDRVWSFVAEGVDVLVSTDHDFIFDHAPLIAALGLDTEIVSFVGNEITTSSYGHINAFPLEVDEDHRTGGALDWGDGTAPTLLPAETYAWAHSFPGEQVVQINHPDGAGTVGALGADLLLGISRFDAEQLGMEPQPVDPETGDTGFWSDDFTAIEVMNGLSRGNFNARARYWLTMLGRGFAPTATAVTDTHKLYGDLGGVPRTFVFVSEDHDTPWTIDPDEFVRSVNAGRAIGTNGPFFRATLRNDAGDVAGLGETVPLGGGVTLDLEIQTAEWLRVDQVDVYWNVREGIYSSTGAADTSELPPTLSVPIELTEDDLVVAGSGVAEHRRYDKQVSIPLDIDEDAYVIVVLRGDDPTLWPVVPRRSETAFAFSNPIFVDADGGGYDQYPLQDLIDRVLASKNRPSVTAAPLPALDGFSPGTREWMAELLHRISCTH